MAFSLTQPGGWFDIPDSVWAAGAEVMEDHLVALNSLVRFAAVCDEYLPASPQKDGAAVALGVSADDGYGYSRSEVLYAWAMQSSPNPKTGTDGGQGNILFVNQFVDQDTGVVASILNYYVQGGQETATTDGLVAALLCCRRGAGAQAARPGAQLGVAGGTGGGVAGGGGGIPTGVSPFQDAAGGDQGTQGSGRQTGPRPLV